MASAGKEEAKKERIVIACVVFEVDKVVRPIIEYDPVKVHLIHYTSKEKDTGSVYQKFYEEVYRQITRYSDAKKEFGKDPIEITEHCKNKVSDFKLMLRTIVKIIQDERKRNEYSEIYVNISSGTSEYCAAATLAGLMFDENVKAFSVGTEKDGYTIPDDKIKDIYFEGDKPIGLTKKAARPKELPPYTVSIPDENLVRGLKLFSEFDKKTSTAVIVEAMKNKEEVWIERTYEKPGGNRGDSDQANLMKYRRNFLEKWESRNWVAKKGLGKRYEVTKAGWVAIETLYIEDAFGEDDEGDE